MKQLLLKFRENDIELVNSLENYAKKNNLTLTATIRDLLKLGIKSHEKNFCIEDNKLIQKKEI